MKLYKYWAVEKQKITIDGKLQEATFYGGSNISVEDARLKAGEKVGKIERKIAGEKHLFDDYEAEIREELLQIIDDHSAITRNRYGAQVLNTENVMFLDIDKPKATFSGLFKKKDSQSAKTQIFEMVKKLATTKYKDYCFRIYETYQGARVMVLGKDFDPRAHETRKMMDEFNCDPLYTMLCVKQGCYRARLTPKPYRIKVRGYKVKYPRQDDGEFQRWLSEYEAVSRGFSVCKLIEQIGSSPYGNDVIRIHDDISGVAYPQKLA